MTGQEAMPGRSAVTLTEAMLRGFTDVVGRHFAHVPLTLPASWLGTPEIRAALADAVDPARQFLFHEMQSLVCAAGLRVGCDYRMDVATEIAPPRIVVTVALRDGEGVAVQHLTSTLRIVAQGQMPPSRLPRGSDVAAVAIGTVGPAEVAGYVDLAGDTNPLHRPAAGRASVVIPGMLLLALIEAAIARPEARPIRLAARFLAPLATPATLLLRSRIVRCDAAEIVLRLEAGTATVPVACIADAVLARPPRA